VGSQQLDDPSNILMDERAASGSEDYVATRRSTAGSADTMKMPVNKSARSVVDQATWCRLGAVRPRETSDNTFACYVHARVQTTCNAGYMPLYHGNEAAHDPHWVPSPTKARMPHAKPMTKLSTFQPSCRNYEDYHDNYFCTVTHGCPKEIAYELGQSAPSVCARCRHPIAPRYPPAFRGCARLTTTITRSPAVGPCLRTAACIHVHVHTCM